MTALKISKKAVKVGFEWPNEELLYDCVLSEILKTSRGNAEKIINEGRIFVNFENINKLTKQIKEKDLITVRGKGRFEIAKIDGITKNNRIKLIVNKFV